MKVNKCESCAVINYRKYVCYVNGKQYQRRNILQLSAKVTSDQLDRTHCGKQSAVLNCF